MKRKKFGTVIKNARESKNLTIEECANKIMIADGLPISFQYLDDIENDRKKPPKENIIVQLSEVLDIPIEVLYFYGKIFPKNTKQDIEDNKIVKAYREFVKNLT